MRGNRKSPFPLRLALLALALSLIAGASPAAHAKTVRRHQKSAFAVALQPFQMVDHAVRAVAEPAVYHVPRVFERASDSLQVAYYAPRVRRPLPPRPPRAEIADDEEDSERPAETEIAQDFQPTSGSHPTVGGSRAVLRNGVAYAPANAPANVKNAIWAANGLRAKPYVWGGGHGSFNDYGYDCSGTVSYALHYAGVLATPIPSSEFMRYGERGRGRWITVYARSGHTFAVIAGLRLDTTDFRSGGNIGPRWHDDGRDTYDFEARHPAGL